MTDERFEPSADMRLLDLQRRELGIAAGASTWQTRSTLDLPHAAVEAPAPQPSGAIVVATLDAQPRTGLIPGAVVTVALALANDGDTPVAEVRAALALPLETAIRPGSLEIDGAPAAEARAAELFGGGLSVGTLEPGRRRTLVVRLLIEPGRTLPAITADVRAAGAAVLGPRAVRLERGAAPPAPAISERPFYESDDDEAAAEPPPPHLSVVQPAEQPELPPAPASPPAALAERRGPGLHVRGQGGPVLTVALSAARLATLATLFGERSLGMVAHYLLLNALAATESLPGDAQAPDLRAFIAAQEQLLSRALIATRLGKTPTAESVAAPLPPFPPPFVPRSGQVELPAPAGTGRMLLRAFKDSEIAFIARMVGNVDAHPFLRAAQLFAGMCASDAALGDETLRRRLGTALATYAAHAASEINRIFLRAKLTRVPEPFKATSRELDDAARAVLDALLASART